MIDTTIYIPELLNCLHQEFGSDLFMSGSRAVTCGTKQPKAVISIL